MTFFFAGRHPKAMSDALDATMSALEPHVGLSIMNGRRSKLSKRHLTAFRKWFAPNKNIDWATGVDFYMLPGNDPHLRSAEVEEWKFRFWLRSALNVDPTKEVGVWQLFMPAEELRDRPDDFKDLFHDLAQTIPFLSGYAGWTLAVDDRPALDTTCEVAVSLLERYHRLDCNFEIYVHDYMLNKVKGVGWLTALDEERFAACLRQDGARKTLEGTARTTRCGTGRVIELLGAPRFWNDPTTDDLGQYRALHEFVHPVRVGRDDFEVSQFGANYTPALKNWLRRFDP